MRKKIAAFLGAIALILGLGIVNAPTASAHGGSCGSGYTHIDTWSINGTGGNAVAQTGMYRKAVSGGTNYCVVVNRVGSYDGANASRTIARISNFTTGATVNEDDGIYSHYAGPIYHTCTTGNRRVLRGFLYTPAGALIGSTNLTTTC